MRGAAVKLHARGHTKREAMRVLTRHLDDAIYRHMTRDLERQHKGDTLAKRDAD